MPIIVDYAVHPQNKYVVSLCDNGEVHVSDLKGWHTILTTIPSKMRITIVDENGNENFEYLENPNGEKTVCFTEDSLVVKFKGNYFIAIDTFLLLRKYCDQEKMDLITGIRK